VAQLLDRFVCSSAFLPTVGIHLHHDQDALSAPKPISDPVAAKIPNKDYPWFLSDIDHKITPEVYDRLQRLKLL
jgi:hypothetical protein